MNGPWEFLLSREVRENDVWMPADKDGKLILVAGPLFRKLIGIVTELQRWQRYDFPIPQMRTGFKTEDNLPPDDTHIERESFDPIKYYEWYEDGTKSFPRIGFVRVY